MKKFTHIKTRQRFIERANLRHNNKFDYSKVAFPKREPARTWQGKQTRKSSEYYGEAKIIITCPIHGDFIQRARKHIEKSPSGCPYCGQQKITDALVGRGGEHDFMSAHKFFINEGTVNIKSTPSDGIEREIILSLKDKEILSYSKWHVTGHQESRRGRTLYGYAQQTNRMKEEGYEWLGVKPKMHRIVMSRILGREIKKSENVDHINNNGLDNRRENLRIATNSQNHANTKKQTGAYTSTYKGVYRRKDRLHLGWYACIGSAKGINRVSREYLGRYETEEQAARAYDKRAKELYGEYALLNFPKNKL